MASSSNNFLHGLLGLRGGCGVATSLEFASCQLSSDSGIASYLASDRQSSTIAKDSKRKHPIYLPSSYNNIA